MKSMPFKLIWGSIRADIAAEPGQLCHGSLPTMKKVTSEEQVPLLEGIDLIGRSVEEASEFALASPTLTSAFSIPLPGWDFFANFRLLLA